MIKEKYWQKTISIAFLAHIIQGVAMAIAGSTINPLMSLGMIIIALASLFRFYTASDIDLSEQENELIRYAKLDMPEK